MVREAVVRAKEDWANKVAAESEVARRDGQVRWGSVCSLQKAHSGCRPVEIAVVLKTDGELTKRPEEVVNCWYEHLKNLLNIWSIMMRRLLLLHLSGHHYFNMMNPPLRRSWRWSCLKLRLGR